MERQIYLVIAGLGIAVAGLLKIASARDTTAVIEAKPEPAHAPIDNDSDGKPDSDDVVSHDGPAGDPPPSEDIDGLGLDSVDD